MDRNEPKEPFDFAIGFRRLRAAVKAYPKAAMFELADEGFSSVFEQLVSCIISIRTFEEVTLSSARRLFQTARKPGQISSLSAEQVDALIRPCTFHTPKAKQILEIAKVTVERHAGVLPADMSTLLEFAGVGLKCATRARRVDGRAHGHSR